MWRDDRQASEAIWSLLQRAGHPPLLGLWGKVSGPSNRAWELYDSKGGALGLGERTLLFACFAFWNGSEGLDFSAVVHGPIDATCARLVLSLALAVQEGPEAVDAWIRNGGSDELEPRSPTCPVCLLQGHEPIVLPSGERCCPFQLRPGRPVHGT